MEIQAFSLAPICIRTYLFDRIDYVHHLLIFNINQLKRSRTHRCSLQYHQIVTIEKMPKN